MAVVVSAIGCASPGIPRPPSLHLPAPVTDLSAIRVGDRVELGWTSPTKTTDGLDLTIPTTVVICRDSALVASSSLPCTPIVSLPGQPGMSTAVDHLPSTLTQSTLPRPLLAYRIRIVNAGNRSASPSAPVFVPGGPSLHPVPGFRAVQQKAGVFLQWSTETLKDASTSEKAIVEVLRSPEAAPPSPTRKLPNPTRLQADVSGNPALAQDGMIDQSVLKEHTYTYRARRMATLTAASKFIEFFSEPSPPITLTTKDTFSPEAPSGLASIPFTTGGSSLSTIDLTWRPNTEADLVGYIVYRADLAGAPPLRFIRLVSAPVPGPAYRDAAALPGHRYAYQVSAVDSNGNESKPSSPVEDSIGP